MAKKLKKVLHLESPAGKKQAGYKKEAKAQNLLSIQELAKKLEEGTLNITDLQSDDKFRVYGDSIKLDSTILSEADEKGFIHLENYIIFSEKNFHNLHILEEGYKFLLDNQQKMVADNPEFACVNPNHTGDYPEQSFGEFTVTEMNFTDGVLKANIDLDINHPAFATQKYALEQDSELQLGFSIEIGAIDGGFAYDKEDKAFLYSKPVIVGLATTLIPSAPATLTNLDTTDKTTVEETVDLAVAEPPESAEENLVEAGDTVLNANNELHYIASIIRDTTFTYQDIVCTESDPVALLYNPAYWDWESEEGNYSFANISTLTKVKYNCEPTLLSVLKEKIAVSMTKIDLPEEIKPFETPKEAETYIEPTNLDAVKVEYEAKLTAEIQKLSIQFLEKFDELEKTFNNEINQVKLNSENSTGIVISTLTSQNETLAAQNKLLKRLEALSNPKPITTF